MESVSYRFHNADVAAYASDAVAPCTLLHANWAVGPQKANHSKHGPEPIARTS